MKIIKVSPRPPPSGVLPYFERVENFRADDAEPFLCISQGCQVYITKSLCNIVTFETKCKELDECQWLQSLTTKPKLRTYIEYKQTFGTEEYVK